MKLRVNISLVLLLSSILLFAAPYHGEVFPFNQPDGSVVRVKLYGDEFYMRAESLDGFTLVRDSSTDWICYADLSDDKTKLISTGQHYSDRKLKSSVQLASLGIQKHLDISKSARISNADLNRTLLGSVTGNKSTSTEKNLSSERKLVVGAIKGLTIAVDFNDATSIVSKDSIERFFNETGFTGFGNNGSVKDYYFDVSGGLLIYENVVFGYFRAPKTFAEYDAMRIGEGAREILGQALQWIDDQGFDFSTLSIIDGRIQAINLVYPGRPKNWAKGMWYHSSTFFSFKADSVISGNYSASPASEGMGIGTVCHENGHTLFAWPDTYKFNNNTGSDGIGAFDLMCASGSKTNPVPPNPYLRYRTGWEMAIDIDTAKQEFFEGSNSTTSYKYTNPSNLKEYFLIEPRSKTGRSSEIPDEGLTIWHCNEEGNNQTENHEIYLEHANNNIDMHDGACWHLGGNTTFNDTTLSNARWVIGTHSGLRVSNVSAAGDTMSFTIGTPGEAEKASMISPMPGGSFDSTAHTFTWNRPVGATNFDILFGTRGAGSGNIRSSSTFDSTSITISNIPSDGGPIFVRLFTYNGSWMYTDYSYSASIGDDAVASVLSPAPGSTFNSSSVTFAWERPYVASAFDFYVGTSGPGSYNIKFTDVFNDTSKTISGIPSNGETVYVRLWTLYGSWMYNDFIYKAFTAGNLKASMISPTPGSTLDSTSQKFTWDRPEGATNFDLFVGNSIPGSSNLRSSSAFDSTSITINDISSIVGDTLYVRLWTYNKGWLFSDYIYLLEEIPSAFFSGSVENISVFPNPTQDKFIIRLGERKSAYITIYNMNGKLVYSTMAKDSQIEVDANNLSPGLYLIRISNNTEIFTKRILINSYH